jgi:hypothetical protein
MSTAWSRCTCTGSVATGEACPPQSDIDVLVVTRDGGSSAAVADAAKELSWRYRHLAREVGIAHVTMAGLLGDDLDALGGRCFIKHYCVPLHGDDLRAQLPRYRPSATMAWAFNHNVAAVIAETRQRLDATGDSGDVEQLCRSVARKVMLAAASLTSVISSEWTTDRHRAAATIAEHHPEWADQAAMALQWASAPTDDPSKVRTFVDRFGEWVARELHDRAAPVNNRDVGIDPHVDAVLALRSATVDRHSGDSFGAVKGRRRCFLGRRRDRCRHYAKGRHDGGDTGQQSSVNG